MVSLLFGGKSNSLSGLTRRLSRPGPRAARAGPKICLKPFVRPPYPFSLSIEVAPYVKTGLLANLVAGPHWLVPVSRAAEARRGYGDNNSLSVRTLRTTTHNQQDSTLVHKVETPRLR